MAGILSRPQWEEINEQSCSNPKHNPILDGYTYCHLKKGYTGNVLGRYTFFLITSWKYSGDDAGIFR